MVDKYGEWTAKANIHVDQRPLVIQQAERAVYFNQRNHNSLKRNNHCSYHQEKEILVHLAIVTNKVMGRHRRKKSNQ
ncbi:hypothetical protein D3C74_435680 [compost metagenome]